ncbi:hypothetical protein BQ8482_110782 [Mesorhizobium delmotii]|uniref:Uncharacterized protein n=1 Tax=Mesorhizobium delmotii TaxID=1631247 RepID=A0A2P9ACJ6_9HYPH|nr:hypothetical protein BQ8482_110782 [Mesorhizobium delmotii]
MAAMRSVQGCRLRQFRPALHTGHACGLETTAAIVYIKLKFLVGMAKSGSTRSRSFLLPSDHQ